MQHGVRYGGAGGLAAPGVPGGPRGARLRVCLPPALDTARLGEFCTLPARVGYSIQPGPLKAVADRLRAGDPARLLGSGDAVYCLAYALQWYVYGWPATLKTDPALRKDTLLTLDPLVDAGSSAAYRMRDDFATPNVDV